MSYGFNNEKDQIARVTLCNLSKSERDPGSVLKQRVTGRIQNTDLAHTTVQTN